MNQRLLKIAYLFVWAMILGFALPLPSVAQDATPISKITPLWTNTKNYCPEEDCDRMWRLSADGEHIFLLVAYKSGQFAMMYVFSIGRDKVVSYKVETYPTVNFPSYYYISQYFDYFPIDDHVILYAEQSGLGSLVRLDLSTGERHVFGVESGLVSCLNRYEYHSPFNVFHYLPNIHALLVCRGSYDPTKWTDHTIWTVDLKDGAVTEVVHIPDVDYLNIVGGRDGLIYVEPWNSSYWSFIPDYRKRQTSTIFIARWKPETSDWELLEFPNDKFKTEDPSFCWDRFMGIDMQSNLYFQNYCDRNIKLKVTKANPITKAVQVIKGDQFGWNPVLIGLDADGQMIILNRMTVPSANTTVEVDVISRYEFDAPNN